MSLSTTGAFGALFNSISPVYLFPVLLSLYSHSFWVNFCILVAFAAISLATARAAVALMETCHSDLSVELLPEGQRKVEQHTVSLVQNARDCFGDSVYSASCALCLVIACNLSTLSLSFLEFLYGDEWTVVLVGIGGVLLSLLSLASFEQMSFLHIVLAACKLTLCLTVQLSHEIFAGWSQPLLLLPTVFAYHIPLAEVLSVMKRKGEKVGLQWALVGGVAAGCVILAQNTSSYSSSSWLHVTQYVLVFPTVAISLQVHWKSLSNLLLVFHYNIGIAQSRRDHPTAAKALELTLHWPLFLYYLYFRPLPDSRLFFLAALGYLLLCLVLLYSYELRLHQTRELTVDPWWAPVLAKYALEIGLLVWIASLGIMGLQRQEETWVVLSPSVLAIAAVAAIRVWSKAGSL